MQDFYVNYYIMILMFDSIQEENSI